MGEVAKEPVVAREVAEEEFKRFLEAMDLSEKFEDAKLKLMTEEDAQGMVKTKAKVVGCIESGRLVIDNKGQAIYTPSSGKDLSPITFHEPTGASLLAMDGAGKGKDMAKMFRMMGDACQCDPSRFAALKQRDLNVCLAVFTLFLGG